MTSFQLYWEMGIAHITDFQGYDHLLFILALCAAYSPQEWRKLLILVTAFTVGHSLTLGLSTQEWINVPASIIEPLIPITILLTSLWNVFFVEKQGSNHRNIAYLMAAGFGLIHGLGFSNYLKALLGQAESIIVPLLAFNLGLEVGQLVIVLGWGVLTALVLGSKLISRRDWTVFLSGIAAGLSILLLSETLFNS
ncbi:MAG: HupE/UreJ family protein [Bacteroidota bacterium]